MRERRSPGTSVRVSAAARARDGSDGLANGARRGSKECVVRPAHGTRRTAARRPAGYSSNIDTAAGWGVAHVGNDARGSADQGKRVRTWWWRVAARWQRVWRAARIRPTSGPGEDTVLVHAGRWERRWSPCARPYSTRLISLCEPAQYAKCRPGKPCRGECTDPSSSPSPARPAPYAHTSCHMMPPLGGTSARQRCASVRRMAVQRERCESASAQGRRYRAASGVPEMPFAESDADRRWAAGVGRLCDSLRAKEVASAG